MGGSSRTVLRRSLRDRQVRAIERCWKRRRVYGKDRGRAAGGATCGWKMAAWSRSYNGPRYETRYVLAFLAVISTRIWTRSAGAQERVAALGCAGTESSWP